MQINLEQARAVLELTMAQYSAVRSDYWAEIYDAVYEYLSGSGPITTYKNKAKKAVVDAYLKAAETAWIDGGGSLPWDSETQAWFVARQSAELGYVDSLFANLKMERSDGDIDAITAAFRHADAYTKTLDSMYSNVKCMAAGSMMLTLVGADGTPPKFPCPECKRYKGQRHRARWWVARNLVPGKGSAYSCGGWECKHVLVTDDLRLFTM